MTSTGWTSDYAPLAQVKNVKNANGFPTGPANPLLAGVYVVIAPSAGAMRQNGPTAITTISDGTSNTTLYSEAAGRNMQCYANRTCVPYDATKITGPIWADSDNRLTVTGSDSTGTTNFGTGPCVMNCNNLQGDIYSFHTGGANVGFADGSVRFMSSSVSIVTLAALVTASSGEVNSDFCPPLGRRHPSAAGFVHRVISKWAMPLLQELGPRLRDGSLGHVVGQSTEPQNLLAASNASMYGPM